MSRGQYFAFLAATWLSPHLSSSIGLGLWAASILQAATSLATIAVAVPYALGGLILGML